MEMSILITKEDGSSLEFEKEICKCDSDEWVTVIICGHEKDHCEIKVRLCDLICAVEKLACSSK